MRSLTAGDRSEMIVFERGAVTEDEHGGEVTTWGELARDFARVRFGSAQEKREAAQEGGTQTATFECYRSAALEAVTLKDRIQYLDSAWDITETAPLDRMTIRFTAARSL